jgi:hypothetical protein
MMNDIVEYVWPVQIVLNVLAVICVVSIFSMSARASRLVAAQLAVSWWWLAVAYHFVFASSTRVSAAWLLSGGTFAGGLAFVWFGVLTSRLQFRPTAGWRGWAGGMVIAYALVAYPLLGHLAGHRSSYEPTLGAPVPTTIFTLGILLFATPSAPRLVFVIPVTWAVVGSLTALLLHVPEDLALLVAGTAAIAGALSGRRATRSPDC